jgi:hypothetical protein
LRLINYIRAAVQRKEELNVNGLNPAAFEDEAYLKPVLEDDALLTYGKHDVGLEERKIRMPGDTRGDVIRYDANTRLCNQEKSLGRVLILSLHEKHGRSSCRVRHELGGSVPEV